MSFDWRALAPIVVGTIPYRVAACAGGELTLGPKGTILASWPPRLTDERREIQNGPVNFEATRTLDDFSCESVQIGVVSHVGPCPRAEIAFQYARHVGVEQRGFMAVYDEKNGARRVLADAVHLLEVKACGRYPSAGRVNGSCDSLQDANSHGPKPEWFDERSKILGVCRLEIGPGWEAFEKRRVYPGDSRRPGTLQKYFRDDDLVGSTARFPPWELSLTKSEPVQNASTKPRYSTLDRW